MKLVFDKLVMAYDEIVNTTGTVQKQPSIGVHIKRCTENMQQVHRRITMQRCDFTKVTKQLYENHTLTWVFSCKFAAYFQNTFS